MHKETPKRLTPKKETIRLLLLRSGNQCAFPECLHSIYNDDNELVAQCCHIEAALSDGGQRFNENQTNEQRREYDNLIFLCHEHHKVTDNEKIYTVDVMKEMKKNHEQKYSDNPFKTNQQNICKVIQAFENSSKELVKIGERLQRIEETLGVNEAPELKNIEIPIYSIPPKINHFFGRKRELENLRNSFHQFNIFQISGVSGIGKSSFISLFISSFDIDKTVWIDCKNTNTLEDFLLQLSNFFIVKHSDYRLSKLIKKSKSIDVLNPLIHILEEYKLILIFDSINYRKHELYQLIEKCNQSLNSSKLIYTTTEDIRDIRWMNTIYNDNLLGLDYEASIELFNISKSIPQEKDRKKLYQLSSGHPFIIKLVGMLSDYQPLEEIVEEVENGSIKDISNYVKDKILNNLEDEETGLINFLASLKIPFRYSIFKYLPFEFDVKKNFKTLQKKYLIIQSINNFYEIPDFIKSHVLIDLTESYDNINSILNYLIKIDNPTIFEYWAIIENSIKVNSLSFAEKYSLIFFKILMSKGYFELLKSILLKLLNDKKTNSWWCVPYNLGRVYRFNEDYAKALELGCTIKPKKFPNFLGLI